MGMRWAPSVNAYVLPHFAGCLRVRDRLQKTRNSPLRAYNPAPMCMYFHLGTDGDAPMEPVWNEHARGFHVGPILVDYEAKVRAQLPHKNVICVGSHLHCGCGFRDHSAIWARKWNPAQNPVDEEEERYIARTHADFAAYLRALPPSPTPIQVYAFWFSGPYYPPQPPRTFTPEDLLDPEFGFYDEELITLIR